MFRTSDYAWPTLIFINYNFLLTDLQKQDLSTVMNLLNIKQYQARALLIHHRWRIDGIYDSLDKGRECMLRNAGIVLQENNSMAAAGSTAAWGTVTCKVCFEDFSMGAVSTMDCGCRVHKPGVPHGPASQQKLGPADDVANDAQTPGSAQIPKR